MKSRHSGAAGQLRRRRSKPSAAVGGQLQVDPPTAPARARGWEDLDGATMERHMRPCRRPWSAHATMELHTPVSSRRSGLRDRREETREGRGKGSEKRGVRERERGK
eukprot:7306050-Prymnesium_polylepis.1